MQLANTLGSTTQSRAVPMGGHTTVVQGINFVDAAEAHILLFGALKDFLSGATHESSVLDVIAQMEQCGLGKWLSDEGRARFGYLAAFDRLCQTHVEFHDGVTDVMLNMREGNWIEAEQLLKHDLARLLRRILISITELNEVAIGDLNESLQKKGIGIN